jgi:enamine deaminase RidA (YjgF/YER057c/UK114 family)
MTTMTLRSLGLSLTVALAFTAGALADDVVRHVPPGATLPIASAVEVPAGKTTVYVSGMVPPVVDDKADKTTPAAFGDTKTQTVGVLKNIDKTLKGLNLTMGNVVKMQAYLVGDTAKGGRMDFAGFMEGYKEFFGTAEQPNLPSRSVMQVAGLVSPGWLVEIEVTAVRP